MSYVDGIEVDDEYPGGNIVVDRIEGDDIYLKPDLTGNSRWWFYWNFRVRGAARRRIHVHFSGRDVIGCGGPAISTDGGCSWAWAGIESVSGNSFQYEVPEGVDEVRFSFTIPYQESDLERFIEQHRNSRHLEVETLSKTRKGRTIRRLHLGKLDGVPRYRVALTCRHHACEAMSSWCLEGILDAFLASTEDGRWFCKNVEVVAVPFMDKDGVEDGEQGKGRSPHDHCRDYTDTGEALYPAVRALKQFLPAWSGGKLRIALDLHDPYIREDHIYFVLNPNEPFKQNTLEFLHLLEKTQQGPLRYSTEHNKVWPSSWGDLRKSNIGWSRALPGMEVPTALELPYSRNYDESVTPAKARLLGADILHAMHLYLEKFAL